MEIAASDPQRQRLRVEDVSRLIRETSMHRSSRIRRMWTSEQFAPSERSPTIGLVWTQNSCRTIMWSDIGAWSHYIQSINSYISWIKQLITFPRRLDNIAFHLKVPRALDYRNLTLAYKFIWLLCDINTAEVISDNHLLRFCMLVDFFAVQSEKLLCWLETWDGRTVVGAGGTE